MKTIYLMKKCIGLGEVTKKVSNPKTIDYYKTLGWVEVKEIIGKVR